MERALTVYPYLTYALCVGILVAVYATVDTATQGRHGVPISIGKRLEPFIDDYLIERMRGVQFVLHHPFPREIVMDHHQPWEGNTCTYHTVFRDGEIFRMYYRGSHYDEAKRQSTHPEVTCYAESKDGIHWSKPSLGLFMFRGSTQNNIVWMGEIGTHNFAPFKDGNPQCLPEARYKALASGKGGLYAFQSPDGLHWSLMRDEPVITEGDFDSLNVVFWDEVRGRYVEFHRKSKEGVRDVMTSTSSDFLNWTKPEYLSYPGVPKEHLYTNAILPYYRAPHLYFGFPMRFVPDKNPMLHIYSGVSDGLFMSSRDGKTFKRWGEAFIRPGLQPARWVNRNNLTAWGLLETASEVPEAPHEISLYSTENYYRGRSCRLRRYTIRLDGFVSIQAPLRGGEFVTKPIIFEGGTLFLNFSTSAAGSIRVEMLDMEGKPIPGFVSPEIVGDSVEYGVPWESGKDLANLSGRPLRMRFVIKDADIYSIQFR
jgi:hypothetical protein